MNHPFEQKLSSVWPAEKWAEVTVLLAVSGGADSMALLRAALAIRPPGPGRLVVVHFNHRLRGAESDADEAFVVAQATRWNCSCQVGSASPPQFPTSDNPLGEDAARRLRYEFFRQAAQQWGARYLLTAHTADDQAETILHRILRGTGLDGLAGIPPCRELLPGVSLMRPLLSVFRAEILEYLAAIGQPFRQDATNVESRFTRNRLRHDLIPLLQRDYNPRVPEALIRLGQLATEAQGLINEATRCLKERAVLRAGPQRATIQCARLAGASSYLVRQLLIDVWRDCNWGMRDMSWEHWNQLAGLAMANSDQVPPTTFPGGIHVTREGGLLDLITTGENR